MEVPQSKYIVIGGRSYLGSRLFASLPEDVPSLRTASLDAEGYFRLRLDFEDDFAALPVVAGDTVFLTAAISAPDVCSREHDRAWAVNVLGTAKLIESVITRGGRLVFCSSDAVYGERADAFADAANCRPAGAYATMKHEIEQRFTGDPRFKAIRLSYIFSREDKFTRYLSMCATTGEEADLFHPFCRAVVHREDVVAGAIALAERWDEVPQQFINFGGPHVLSRVAIAERFREAHFHDLRFKVTEPDADFFVNRPRVIAMTSPAFARLLGRSPRALPEATRLEFPSASNHKRVS
jgi:dTDP-4-dehydrorhamnose reductase